jgi:glucan 1,3-beta-glucosidase
VPHTGEEQPTLASNPFAVNIGGWLILEPWITPSIFQQFPGTAIVDEYTFCQYAPNAQQTLQSHWSSWTGLGDFQKIAGAGFNTVRIPIGYWAFQKYEGDPYIMGAQDYLDQAIGWARQTGLQVVIDLHGESLYLKDAGSRADELPFPQAHSARKMAMTILASFSADLDGRQATLYPPQKMCCA